jgi:divalent metal cation (Fe/Co/Zn/Cd) transporter
MKHFKQLIKLTIFLDEDVEHEEVSEIADELSDALMEFGDVVKVDTEVVDEEEDK